MTKHRSHRTAIRIVVLTVGLLAILTSVALHNYADQQARETDELEAPGPFLAESKRINRLHQEKTSPQANDWLARHHELGQNFGRYYRSRPNGLTHVRTTLFVQPLGEFDEEHIELSRHTAELLSRYYNLPTKILPTIALDDVPTSARRDRDGDTQLLTHYLLNHVLKPARPNEAVGVLGLTTVDLWPGEGWNFVFGQASITERVGVWSLHRFGNPDGEEDEWQQYRRRTFKVALHETGHMLGMPHCIYYECLMNGSNHLAEMDSRPLWLCPECVRKVWWNCKADPATRYEQLIEFGKTHGLKDEVAFWELSKSMVEGRR